MSQIWCNGQWMTFAEFPADPMDRGSILGLSLFETILAIDGRPVFTGRHLARLKHGCERLGWSFYSEGLGEAMGEILAKNQLSQGPARVRLTITAGSGSISKIERAGNSLLWMTALPVSIADETLAANISPWPRNERSPLAGLKSASYAENLIALDHARHLGFQETIFLNTAGNLCEAATSNVFLVKNDVLMTPSLDSGCLPGIAREVVLEIAARCKIPTRQSVLTPDDLHGADEVFLTSSIRGLATVSRIGDQSFETSSMTEKLRELWDLEIGRKCSH